MLNRIIALIKLRRSDSVMVAGEAADRDAHKKHLGRVGELAAVKRLNAEGYRILETNYSCKGGEIDIIAEHLGHIVFVEVKTRSPRSWNSPESAVDSEKQARIIRAAARYIGSYRNPAPARYDIVSVWTNDADAVQKIEIKRAAFEPT